MRFGNFSDFDGMLISQTLWPVPGPTEATRVGWRKGRGDAAARSGRPTFVRGQSRSANDWEPGQPVAKISSINFRIFHNFRNISFKVSNQFNFRYFQVHSSFLMSFHTKNPQKTYKKWAFHLPILPPWHGKNSLKNTMLSCEISRQKLKTKKERKNYVFI